MWGMGTEIFLHSILDAWIQRKGRARYSVRNCVIPQFREQAPACYFVVLKAENWYIECVDVDFIEVLFYVVRRRAGPDVS